MFVGGAVRTVVRFLPSDYQFTEPALQALAHFLAAGYVARKEDLAAKESARLLAERESSLKAVTDEETAVTHLVTVFASLGEELLTRYVESDLAVRR
jgi:hypothetical protein